MTEQVAEDQKAERRRDPTERLAANAMRCASCGTVWYSEISYLTSTWAPCARCGGRLHTERRA